MSDYPDLHPFNMHVALRICQAIEKVIGALSCSPELCGVGPEDYATAAVWACIVSASLAGVHLAELRCVREQSDAEWSASVTRLGRKLAHTTFQAVDIATEID